MSCLTFKATRQHGDLTVHCAILCQTSLGEQYLWAADRLLLSFDGKRFVLKNK